MRSLLRSLPVGVVLTAACTNVRTVQPADLSPANAPTRVWVTRADRSTVVFDSANVRGDSLIGIANGQPQRVALSETTVLRAEEVSEARTLALVALGVGAVAMAVHLMESNNASPIVACAQASLCMSGTPCCCPTIGC